MSHMVPEIKISRSLKGPLPEVPLPQAGTHCKDHFQKYHFRKLAPTVRTTSVRNLRLTVYIYAVDTVHLEETFYRRFSEILNQNQPFPYSIRSTTLLYGVHTPRVCNLQPCLVLEFAFDYVAQKPKRTPNMQH